MSANLCFQGMVRFLAVYPVCCMRYWAIVDLPAYSHPQASYGLTQGRGCYDAEFGCCYACFFGCLFTALGFGNIANAAHVSGLLLGCLSGGSICADRRATVRRNALNYSM